MFTQTYLDSKTHQIDYHKRAAHYRMVKSLEKPNNVVFYLVNVVGQFLVTSGEQLTHSSASIQ
jgi:hypothetical protein